MEKNRLPFDAVILAGGRSSRLGGVPKQDLVFHHATLLQRALAAPRALPAPWWWVRARNFRFRG